MKVIDHLYVIAGEEAAEISRAFARINRFGLDSVHPRTERTAAQDVVHQLNDLLAVIELMKDRGVLFDNVGDPTAIGEAKKKFVEEMETSHEAGLIELPDDEDEGGEVSDTDVEETEEETETEEVEETEETSEEETEEEVETSEEEEETESEETEEEEEEEL